jgi:hypothetical protein
MLVLGGPGYRKTEASVTGSDRYGLAWYSPCFIPKKKATIEKTIIEGRTIMKTVEGCITLVSATDATATITTSGPTERAKSNSIPILVAGQTKEFR